MKGPEEGADSNFTTVMGKKYVDLKPLIALDRLDGYFIDLLEKLVFVAA